jgi:hypothetical protein
MNAAPPPADPPAHVAKGATVARGTRPAVVAEAPSQPGMAARFTGRFGFGAGLGLVPGGLGGSYSAQAEAWPVRNFGLGIEGEAGGALSLFGESSSLKALRGRLSLRFPVSEHGLLAVSLSAGVAHVNASLVTGPDPCTQVETECDPGYFGGGGAETHFDEVSFTGGIELAWRYQTDASELGVFVRASGANYSAFVVVGPTVGFGL